MMIRMLLLLLIVAALCVSGVEPKAPFNFRGSCYVKHLANTFSAQCDGKSQHITTQDLYLDSRTTISMSDMDMMNFENITLHHSIRVQRIKMKNVTRLSIYINNPELTDLEVEDVSVLILKSYNGSEIQKMKRLSLHNVGHLTFDNDEQSKFVCPISNVTITDIDDFALQSNQLIVVTDNFTIGNSHMRFRNKSNFFLKATMVNLTENILYIDDASSLHVEATRLSVENSKVDLENGTMKVFSSIKLLFANNTLYGFKNNSLSLNSNSDVEFLNNDVFTNNIVDLFKLNHNILFKDNHFGCTNCAGVHKLLDVDLKEIGDSNYCYADCELSLNEFKSVLNKHCACANGEENLQLQKLCAPCTIEVDNSSSENSFFSGSKLKYSLFAVIPLGVLVIVVTTCYIYGRSTINPQSESKIGIIYKKPCDNDDDEVEIDYESISNLDLLNVPKPAYNFICIK